MQIFKIEAKKISILCTFKLKRKNTVGYIRPYHFLNLVYL
jgi:hypothetical protein